MTWCCLETKGNIKVSERVDIKYWQKSSIVHLVICFQLNIIYYYCYSKYNATCNKDKNKAFINLC